MGERGNFKKRRKENQPNPCMLQVKRGERNRKREKTERGREREGERKRK